LVSARQARLPISLLLLGALWLCDVRLWRVQNASGGLRYPAVDMPLDNFSQLIANISFKYNVLVGGEDAHSYIIYVDVR
jgi:hypothetical protein